MSAITNKRKASSAFSNMSSKLESMSPNQVNIPVLVDKIWKKSIKDGKKKGNPFWTIKVSTINKKPLYVTPKSNDDASTLVNDGNATKRVKVEGGTTDSDDSSITSNTTRGSVIEPNTELFANCFQLDAVEKVKEGNIQHLKFSTKTWNGGITYQLEGVVENVPCKVSKETYDKYFKGTLSGTLPTVHNMNESQFRPGSDRKYMTRTFVVPLSNDTDVFDTVHVDLPLHSSSDPMAFTSQMNKSDTTPYPGMSEDKGDRRSSCFRVGFSLKDEQNTKIMAKFYAYSPSWRCFGITNVNIWKDVAPRLIIHARDWYMCGFTGLESLEKIGGNRDQMMNLGATYEEQYSGGFITQMGVDMAKTVSMVGLPVTLDYVKNKYFVDHYKDVPEEPIDDHPLNKGSRLVVRSNGPFCLNLNELDDSALAKAFAGIEEKSPNTKFYAIFKNVEYGTPDTVYENVPHKEDEKNNTIFDKDEVTKFIEEGNHVPSVIFAVNEDQKH